MLFSERVQHAKQDLEDSWTSHSTFRTSLIRTASTTSVSTTPEQIRKTAAIAKANAQKEVAQVASPRREANDAVALRENRPEADGPQAPGGST